jgi:aryl-alcohol dehydrogenase-like predicted oxidoreductase
MTRIGVDLFDAFYVHWFREEVIGEPLVVLH